MTSFNAAVSCALSDNAVGSSFFSSTTGSSTSSFSYSARSSSLKVKRLGRSLVSSESLDI